MFRFIEKLQHGQEQKIVTCGACLTAYGAWVKYLEAALDRQFPGLSAVINNASDGQWSVYRETASRRFLPLIDNCSAWNKIYAEDESRFFHLVPDGIHPGEEGSRLVTLAKITKIFL